MGNILESKDFEKLEKIVQDKDEQGFIDLMKYWREIGKEYAYNDTYADIHLLQDLPYRNISSESADFNKLRCELQLLEYDDSDLYQKAKEMLAQTVVDGAESRVKKLSRFICLLGVRQATKQIKGQIEDCMNTVKDKHTVALVSVVELQEKMGFIGEKESKNE
ncbi:hypothetical protein [Holdemanella porci]|uniref:hypothetical protein n=1 Tax=Holdemanella porci TaxID=2652276 RepID=UPI003AEF4967